MRKVEYTRAATADLDGIWDYTFDNWGVSQAERYVDDIRRACEDISSGRRTGRPEPVLDGYFRYPVGKHIVFFTKSDDGICVMRVLHQRMDVDR